MQRLVNTVVAPKVKAAIDMLPLSEYHFSEVSSCAATAVLLLFANNCPTLLSFLICYFV
jgi:hypothetical protein